MYEYRDLVITLEDQSTINAGSVDFQTEDYTNLENRVEKIEKVITAIMVLIGISLVWNLVTMIITLSKKRSIV